MTVTVANPWMFIIAVLLVVVLLVLVLREPRPAMGTGKILYICAFVCFALACVGLAPVPWLPLGLALWVLGMIVG